MTATQEFPFFPLKTVLFSGEILPLKIFEARSLDIVSRHLKSDSSFGVVMVYEGNVVGIRPTSTYLADTLACILGHRPIGRWLTRRHGSGCAVLKCSRSSDSVESVY